MDRQEYDPRFSNAEDTTLLVESVSSHSAGFMKLVLPSQLDVDADLRAEFASFEAASDEDLRAFERLLD